MPLRILMVTGRSPACATASRRIARRSGLLYGRADPPPLRVTLGTGQPKFRSMWSARSSSTIMRTALPTVTGSTPYSWIERGVSLASKWMSCMVFSLRSTSARVVIISLTNSPLPPENSRHRVRKGALVMPAMGASTTGGCTVCGPIWSSGRAGASVVMAPLSRTRAMVRRPPARALRRPRTGPPAGGPGEPARAAARSGVREGRLHEPFEPQPGLLVGGDVRHQTRARRGAQPQVGVFEPEHPHPGVAEDLGAVRGPDDLVPCPDLTELGRGRLQPRQQCLPGRLGQVFRHRRAELGGHRPVHTGQIDDGGAPVLVDVGEQHAVA